MPRRAVRARLVLPALLCLVLGALAAPDVAASARDAPDPAYNGVATGGEARGLRFGLVAALTLAVACGVVAQYQSIGGRRPAAGDPDAAPAPAQANHTVRQSTADPSLVTRPRGARPGATAPARRPVTRPSPAPTATDHPCARAVSAAFVFNRTATVEAFVEALRRDPDVRPAATPGFWEMPASGHADLARAYLRCDRPLDARSLVTLALLSGNHNRELEELQRTISAALTRVQHVA